MGVEDDDMKAIAVVTVLDVLLALAIYCGFALYDGSGAEAFGIFFCLMGAIGMTALDVNLIKEARKKSERKKVKKNKTYIESLEQILEAIEGLRDEENDLLDGMPDNLRYTRQYERAAK